jgi:hypothetical protein
LTESSARVDKSKGSKTEIVSKSSVVESDRFLSVKPDIAQSKRESVISRSKTVGFEKGKEMSASSMAEVSKYKQPTLIENIS